MRLLLLLSLLTASLAVGAQAPWPEAGLEVRGQRDSQGWPLVPDLSKVGRGETIPTVVVAEVVAHQGEGFGATMGRAAKLSAAFTRERGFEACALVCRNGQGELGMKITTNFSQVGCLTRHEQASCPVGYSPTEETFHTHPETTQVRANPVDALFTGQRRGRALAIQPHDFSDNDLHNGPGYLVAMGRLLYQNGGQRHELETAHSAPLLGGD